MKYKFKKTEMKRIYKLKQWSVLLMVAFMTSLSGFAQTAASYGFSTFTGTFTPLVGGTSTSLAATADDAISTTFPIGFSFTYCGTAYTTVQASSNGVLLFGSGRTGTATNNLATTTATQRPGVAPLWDDNQLTSGVTYQLSGASPNQVLTVEWLNLEWNYSSGTSVISYQVMLYETTNVIECLYRQEATAVNAGSASIGIMGTASTDFISLQNSSASPTISTSASTNTINAKPATGQGYRFSPPLPCSGAPLGGTTPALINICNGNTASITATGASTDLGITYQWQVGTTSGGPYTNVTGGTGATTTSYTTGALTAGTYYYVLQVTCSSGPTSSLSTEATVQVNANPTLSVTPASGSLCSGGTPVALTASGTATTYAWSPAAGLSSTTTAATNASPTVTTNYTVIGTDGATGCTASAIASVSVTETPTVTSVTATPPSVCSGGSSQLLTAASLTTPYTLTSTTYNAEIPSGTATNIFTAGDDAVSASIALPFTFTYFGTAYTNLFSYTNGFLELGTSSGSTGAYGAAIPTAATPNSIIAGVWDDLNVTGAGSPTVRYFTNGTAPNRRFIVEYSNVKFYNGAANTGSVSFQIKLYETSNDIEVHITNAVDPAPSAHYTGIENATGTAGLSPGGRNPFSTNITTPEAWLYSLTPALTYSWTPATYLSSTTISNPMASAITADITYTVTVGNGACTSTGTVAITAGSALTSSSNITPSATACEGATVTLNSVPAGGGAPYTYAWAGPNSFTATSQNPTLVTSPAAAGTYTVTVTDNCGSTSSTTVALTVNAAPSISVTPTTGTFCNPGGTAVNLTASGTSTSYAWLPVTGLSVTTGATTDASPIATTTYTVTGTDGNGCTNTATAIINSALAVQIASPTATPAAVCAGSNSVLDGTASFVTSAFCTAGATSTSFEKISNVTFGTINNTSAATAGYENFVAMNTNVAATVSTPISIGVSSAYASDDRIHIWIDQNQDGVFADPAENVMNAAISTFCPGCSGVNTTVTGNITVPVTALNGATRMRIRLQDNSFGANMTPCGTSTYGQVEDYTVTITGGTNASISYVWSPSTFLTSTTVSNPTATAMTSSQTYTVVATSLAGCSVSASIPVTVNSVPTATATTTPILCNAGTSTVIVSATGGTPSYTGTGTFTASAGAYSYTVTDVNGCASTATGTITEPTAVAVTSTQTPVACFGGTSTVTLTTTGGTPAYTGDGVQAPQAAGTTVYTVTDNNGCTGTTSVTVTEPTAIAVTPTSGTIMCNGGTAAVSLTATGGTPAYTGDGVQTPQAVGTTVYTVTDANGCTGTASVTLTEPTALVATSSETSPILCFAGSGTITVSATGGTPSYTGAGAQTSFAGTNTYTVTDANGCVATTTTVVTEPSAMVVSYTETGILCNGGSSSVTISVTGGTPTYAFPFTSGSNTFGQTAGTQVYTVTDANGCTGTASVTVTEPAVLTATATATGSILCNGGTAPVDVVGTGGTTPYTVGTTGTFNQSAGTTVYTVTDANGCSTTASATLTEPTAVMVMTSYAPIMCNGDSTAVTVTAMDGTPSYTGVGTFNQAAGTVTYSVTDANGCLGATNVTITEPAAIANSQSFSFCGSGSVTVGTNTYTTSGVFTDVLTAANSCDSTVTTTIAITVVDVTTTTSLSVITANSTTGTYQWINCGTTSAIAGETNQSYTATADGSYAVEVTDNGCVDTSACVMIIGAGIADNTMNIVEVYPNPTLGAFNIAIANANASELMINIVDIQGKEVFSSVDKNVNGTFNKQVNIENIAKGVYYIKVNTGAELKIEKLVIQ